MWPASLWACGVPLDRPGTAAGHSGQDPEWFRTPRIGANDDHGALERQEIIRRGRGASTHQRPGPSGSAPHRLHTPPARHPHQLSSLGGSAGHRLDAPTANELAGYTEPQVGPDMSNPDEAVRLPHTRQATRSERRERRPGAPMVTSGYANLSTGLVEQSRQALVPTGDSRRVWCGPSVGPGASTRRGAVAGRSATPGVAAGHDPIPGDAGQRVGVFLRELHRGPADERLDRAAVLIEHRDREIQRPRHLRRGPVPARPADRQAPRGYPNRGGAGGPTGRCAGSTSVVGVPPVSGPRSHRTTRVSQIRRNVPPPSRVDPGRVETE